jgi:cytochrome c oxidase assembly protein subunit 11
MSAELAPTADRNHRVGIIAASLAIGMLGMAYASVPLYQLFCQVTGFGGTTQRATSAPSEIVPQLVEVRFDANTDRDLPWEFRPKQTVVNIKIGEQGLAFYQAKNVSDKPITGMASFNVSPDIAGQYFHKIQCFCFNEQRLEPGQTIDMPVIYYVDPEILKDPTARALREITLSYTFHRQPETADARGAGE